MKKFLPLFLLCIFSLGFGQKTVPVYRMALLLPVSGEHQNIGKSIQEGAAAFLKTMQSVNGFEKFRLEITVLDTESKRENAEKLLQYIDQKHAQFSLISGGINNFEIDRLIEISEKHKIPYLASFEVSFKNKLRQYYFPLIPSLYHGFKFAMRFFEEKKIPFKIIYDDTTKTDAFLLSDPTVLLDINAPDFQEKLTRAAILFVSQENAQKALTAIGERSLKLFNFNQLGLPSSAGDAKLYEGALFLNWVKNSKTDPVEYFQESFNKIYNNRPNNYHMLGWILSDIFYETFLRLSKQGHEMVMRGQIVEFLERFSWNGGYNDGAGYNIFYAPYSFAADETRAGISGMYFMEIQKGKPVIISDYTPLFTDLNKHRKPLEEIEKLESEERQKMAELNASTNPPKAT
ncbi:MAG: hypothetical protein CVV50_02565, partial [Spirochaetae bacterium HGW-Spirochaetae-6]